MCRKYTKHLSTFIISIVTALPAIAQNNDPKGENVPYSRFGIGELRTGVSPMLRGMGNISSAYANPYALNTDNPASYGSLKLTTYEAGGDAGTRTTRIGTSEYKSGNATLSYMNVGIPVSKHVGVSLGLRPVSKSYYSLADTTVIPGYGQAITQTQGDGTINYGFIGAGGKYKGISIGFNFGYMFGTLVSNNYMQDYNDSQKVQKAAFLSSTKVGGIYWKSGAQYETKLNKKLSLRIGGTFTLSQSLNTSLNENWISVSNASTTVNANGISEFTSDTLYSVTESKNTIVLPMTYSIGAQLFNTDKWAAGVDFTSTNWSEFRKYGKTDSVADNTMRIAVGAEYTPGANSLRKYFQRVTYRIGFYYGNDYVRLNNTDLNYYAATAGLSLPFKRSTDRLHLAFEYGKRGNGSTLYEENFLKFSLGISLNDKWFIKRKYE